jgi:hypothetical protein
MSEKNIFYNNLENISKFLFIEINFVILVNREELYVIIICQIILYSIILFTTNSTLENHNFSNLINQRLFESFK